MNDDLIDNNELSIDELDAVAGGGFRFLQHRTHHVQSSQIFNKGDDTPLNYLGLFNASSM